MSEPPDLASAAPSEDFEDLFENAPCGYLTMSPEGRIRRANATFSSWAGFSPEALAGRSLRALLTTPGSIFYETNVVPSLRLYGGFEEVALDLVTAGGDKLPLLVNARARKDERGEVVSLLVVAFRAIERRGYERDLRGREAAAVRSLADERSTADLREQFIAVLGHDLRNPLAAVASGVSLLQRNPTPERADKIASMMRKSIVRMTDLVDNLMDFARGRLGDGISLHLRPADLQPVFSQVVDELRAAHRDQIIEERYDLPRPVVCDAARLSQLLSNLLGNACTHGDVERPIFVTAAQDATGLTLSVINSGKMIPFAALQKLFQPFQRGSVSPGQQGLGLGLFIANEIAIAHNGKLTAHSTDLETIFVFSMSDLSE